MFRGVKMQFNTTITTCLTLKGEDKFGLVIDGQHIPYKPEWVMHSQPWRFRGGMLNGYLASDSSVLMHGMLEQNVIL